ncbi:MAG: hypothetical protein U0V73_00755 [Acidimicrobiia bacterium]
MDRETVLLTVIDIGLAHPTAHRLGRYINIDSDLSQGQIIPTRDRDHITLELGRERLRHGAILSTRPRRAQAVSTNHAADPSSG